MEVPHSGYHVVTGKIKMFKKDGKTREKHTYQMQIIAKKALREDEEGGDW